MDSVGIQRLTLKTLNTRITNSLVIGVIIGKQNVRKFNSKKDGNDRAVWNFTLRDSITDYINVTCWGSGAFIDNLSGKFHIGDVVDVINAKIDVRHIDDNSEQYRPAVTSPFTLTVNERSSNIIIHNGDNYNTYIKLLNYPTKPTTVFLTLADIYNNGGTIRGDFVDLLVAVRSVNPIRTLTSKKNGSTIYKRDVVVFDQTNPGLGITFWEDEYIQRAEQWKPRETILFLADMKVDWSDFQRSMVAVVTSRTIITENPNIPEADILKEYARTAALHRTAILDQMASSIPDPKTICTLMTVQHVLDKVNNQNVGPAVENQQFTALLYVFPTHFDLDGFAKIVSTRCDRCNSLINESIGMCINLECPVGSGAELGTPETKFDIRVNLTDHTGTLESCRLAGSHAENILMINVREFDRLSADEKCVMKWKYLMERCAARILVVRSKFDKPMVSILGLELTNPFEVSSKLPIY